MAKRKTLNVSLTPHWARFIEKQVRAGRYQSASEVVRHALALVEHSEARRDAERDEIRRKIEEGYQQAVRGELIPGDVVFDRIREMSRKRRARRKAS